MKIIFTGPKIVRRVIGEYEWSRETGFAQEVKEADLAASLVTYPGDQFALAGADGDEIKELSEILGITQKEVKSMIVEKPKASLISEPSVRDKIKEV
jgi:hypothetical protein